MTDPTSGRRPLKRIDPALILLAVAVCFIPLLLGGIVKLHTDFFNELWGPAHLLVQGRSPYDTASLKPGLPAVWLPMAIGVFAPLGWFQEDTATQIWFVLNVAAMTALVYLSLGRSGSPAIAGVALLFAYLFPPTINHFQLGQISIISALCMLLAARFAHQQRDWLMAFTLALGISKPQLGVLAVIGLGTLYLTRSGASGVVKFLLRLLIASLILSLPVFAIHPAWMIDWLAGMRANPAWSHPSAFVLLQDSLGGPGRVLWGLTALTALAACLYFWRKFPPETAMAWTLGLTVLISPYVWSWDFVLLLPLWISTFAAANARIRTLLVITYLIGWIGMAYTQQHFSGNNMAFWWVPWWFMGTILVADLPDLKSPRRMKASH